MKKPVEEDKLKMQKYVITLRQQLQEKSEQLANKYALEKISIYNIWKIPGK